MLELCWELLKTLKNKIQKRTKLEEKYSSIFSLQSLWFYGLSKNGAEQFVPKVVRDTANYFKYLVL